LEAQERLIVNVLAETGLTKYQTAITSGNHSILIDEPISNGGADIGMNPQELLMASLGSCTAITLRMYLDRKQWPVSKISVNVEVFSTGLMQNIKCIIGYEGELAPEQELRLVQIANACPIHKILAKSLVIETVLK
jgi:putative redox protein